MNKHFTIIKYGDPSCDGHGRYEIKPIISSTDGETIESLIGKIIAEYELDYLEDVDCSGMKEETYFQLLSSAEEKNEQARFYEIVENYENELYETKFNKRQETYYYTSIDFIHEIVKFLLSIKYGIEIENLEYYDLGLFLGYGNLAF